MPTHAIDVSNLPKDVSSQEVDELFFKFGKIIKVKVKSSNAIVYFDTQKAADDARRSKDGFTYDGYTLSVTGISNMRSSNKRRKRSRSSSSGSGSSINRSRSNSPKGRGKKEKEKSLSPPPPYKNPRPIPERAQRALGEGC